MKFSPYGKREWLGGGAVALLLISAGIVMALRTNVLAGTFISICAAVAWVAIAAFFRVPNRTGSQNPEWILSPADGVVKDITTIQDHGIAPFAGQPLHCIGIFLSIFDVHINRAPVDFQVDYRNYKKGCFLDARNPRCAKENESLVIAGTACANDRSFPIAVRQISGAVARRIICTANPKTALRKGEIYGMIKFGSRTELYLPADSFISLTVHPGDRVRGGLTPLAKINSSKNNHEK